MVRVHTLDELEAAIDAELGPLEVAGDGAGVPARRIVQPEGVVVCGDDRAVVEGEQRQQDDRRIEEDEAQEGQQPEGLPDVYIAMGQTAENVAELEQVAAPGLVLVPPPGDVEG